MLPGHREAFAGVEGAKCSMATWKALHLLLHVRTEATSYQHPASPYGLDSYVILENGEPFEMWFWVSLCETSCEYIRVSSPNLQEFLIFRELL